MIHVYIGVSLPPLFCYLFPFTVSNSLLLFCFDSPLDKERMDSVGDCGVEKSSIVRIFGHDVTDFSSQYGAETRLSYVAANLAGDYTIYPNYGDFTQACVFVSEGG